MSWGPFQGIKQQPAAIDSLRAAAGIWIPNHGFRHANANIYTGSKTGDDGLTWYQSKYRGWFYVGYDPSDNRGNYLGAANPYGYLDGVSVYLSTSGTTTGQSISTDHQVLDITIFTDYLPFGRFYTGHYDKPLTLALVARFPTDVVIGTDVKAYVAAYDSDGAFITAGTHSGFTEANPSELVFADAGEYGTNAWAQYLATTEEVLPDNTAFVILHLGFKSPDAASTAFILGDVSLMVNPTNNDTAETVDPELFVDLDPVTLRVGSAMAWEALGTSERIMLDGHRRRSSAIRDNLKARFNAVFTKTSDTAYQQLLALWALGVKGLGLYVPEPVPLCIDFGLGQLPFFGYYNIVRASFDGTFHPHWTLAGQGYDIALQLEEA